MVRKCDEIDMDMMDDHVPDSAPSDFRGFVLWADFAASVLQAVRCEIRVRKAGDTVSATPLVMYPSVRGGGTRF